MRYFGDEVFVTVALENHYRRSCNVFHGLATLGFALVLHEIDRGQASTRRRLFHIDDGPGLNIVPRSATAMTDNACRAESRQRGAVDGINGDIYERRSIAHLFTVVQHWASSFSPPMTTMPSMFTVSSTLRIASTAALSADFLLPRPTQRCG